MNLIFVAYLSPMRTWALCPTHPPLPYLFSFSALPLPFFRFYFVDRQVFSAVVPTRVLRRSFTQQTNKCTLIIIMADA